MLNNSAHDRKVPLKRKVFLALAVIICWPFIASATISVATIPAPLDECLQKAYSRAETLFYEISWMGVQAGTLTISLVPDKNDKDKFYVRVKAKSSGLLKVFYPVDDQFETTVTGTARLPIKYSSDLHEGSRHKKKLMTYNQQDGIIVYQKNDEPTQTYNVDGPVYNEFTSFMIMRTLPLHVGHDLMVPTFAEKKRHEVVVKVAKKEKIHSIFGKIEAFKVMPQLPFKGLYQKTGAPVIWLSNEPARIPVKIKAKVLIGSLAARLVDYHGQKKVPKLKPVASSEEEPFL